MHSNYLVLVRHGQSEWNAKNLFTGWKDPDLTDKGIEEAVNAGKKINEYGLSFSCMFTSALVRAQNTAKIILKEILILQNFHNPCVQNFPLQIGL